ncbi:MAG: hypothetical protein LBI58_01635 [Tannerellaceae bacterium]|jgi:hypothetical protein|nr:hypothetical protein [Tannerellaceae bacterium]
MNKIIFCGLVFICGLMAQCTGSDMANGLGTEGLILNPGQCLPDVGDRYIYPVATGEETLELPTADKVKSLSTYALICSVLDHPQLWYVYASSDSSPVASFDRFVFSIHNSVPEFEKREDRIQALLSYYSAVSHDCYNSLDTWEQMTFSAQLSVLELWFIRDGILLSMSSGQKKQAVSLLLHKHQQREDYASLIAMAWIMYQDSYSPIMEYYKDGTPVKEHLTVYKRDDVIAFAEKYTH